MRRKKQPIKKLNAVMRKKLAGVFAFFLLALVGLAIGITYINATSGNKYTKQVLTQSQQQYDSRVIPFKRGDITDRNGTVLAASSKVYNVILDCNAVNSKEDYLEPTLEALKEGLGISEEEVKTLLTNEETKSSQYQILKKGITMDEKKTFEKLKEVPKDTDMTKDEVKKRNNIQGIWFEEDYSRSYPFGSLACDTIGFTFAGNTADWGMEGYYNGTLNGINGRQYGYFNNDSDLEQTIVDPVNGNNLVSTIDVNIQQIIEKYISGYEKAMANGPFGKMGAKNVGVILSNPSNGEILGMASSDPYDLNNPRDLSGLYTDDEIKAMNDQQTLDALNKMWQNYCITEAYEPGSVVKPFVMAAALQTGAIVETDTFNCDGGQKVGDRFIKCSVYPNSHGTQSLGEVIQNSCNDGMMQIGKKLGAEELANYQGIYNLGKKTGIDLPGEGAGIVYTAENMNVVELATSSFGQGFTCTMVQEMGAICSLINGGTYYQPHVVNRITDSDGKTIKNIEPVVLKETISSDISEDIRNFMKMSVDNGTSKTSKVAGYSMGGKTGTAQKLPRGNKKYLVSYVGFAPVDVPQIAIYVVIDEPNIEEQANSRYPQYIAQAILSEVLPYMNIFPDEGTETATTLWQGFTGIKKQNDLTATGTDENTPTGDGIADTSVPAPPEGTEDESTKVGGNGQDSDGITNEEAGFTD